MLTFLFFGLPLAALVWFLISLHQYLSAKKENRLKPGFHDEKEITHRKWIAIVSGIIAGVLLSVVIGFFILLSLSIAYM